MKSVFLMGLMGYVGILAKDIPLKIINLYCRQVTSTITVSSTNQEQYIKLNKWLLGLNKKSITNNIEVSNLSENNKGQNTQSINYGNYMVKLDNLTFAFVNKEMKENGAWEIINILTVTIFGKNKKKYFDIIKENLNKNNIDGTRVFSRSNIYDCGKMFSKRTFDNIYLDGKERIIKHLDNWIKNKNTYIRNGIVYKTGILLYGEPGCGKSSIARAIASYLDYDIYYINLRGYENYKELSEKLNSISRRSVILLEDIDCLIGDRNNEDDNNKSELLNTALNFIDGVLSPEECVFVATTNHIEKLDSAFVRDGRFDLKFETKKISRELCEEMCKSFNIEFSSLNVNAPINPSHLQNIILSKIKEREDV